MVHCLISIGCSCPAAFTLVSVLQWKAIFTKIEKIVPGVEKFPFLHRTSLTTFLEIVSIINIVVRHMGVSF